MGRAFLCGITFELIGWSSPFASLALGSGIRGILLGPKFGEGADQFVRNGLIQRESKVSLLARVDGRFLLQFGVSSDGWVEADVALEGREVHKDAMLLECRHAIADYFRRARRRSPHSGAELLQDGSHLRLKRSDVLID